MQTENYAKLMEDSEKNTEMKCKSKRLRNKALVVINLVLLFTTFVALNWNFYLSYEIYKVKLAEVDEQSNQSFLMNKIKSYIKNEKFITNSIDVSVKTLSLFVIVLKKKLGCSQKVKLENP